MKVLIVGSGNVAESLAFAVAESRLTLAGIVARDKSRGNMLAEACGCGYHALDDRLPEADLCLISVSDSAVEELSERLPLSPDCVAAHTAGGISIDALKHPHRAVLYPLQTFTRGRRIDLHTVPLFVEASDGLAAEVVMEAASALSNTVHKADSQTRCALHVAAVFACNFVNRMYGIGGEIMQQAGLDYDMLKPLIAETAAKAVSTDTPAKVQTGPAVRGDDVTMARHLNLIADKETETELYRIISRSIYQQRNAGKKGEKKI